MNGRSLPLPFRIVKRMYVEGYHPRRFRPIAWRSIKLPADNSVAEHCDVIGERDEGGFAKAGADEPAGFVVGELDHQNKFTIDSSLAELDVAIWPEFKGFHKASFRPSGRTGTIADGEGGATALPGGDGE